jgi:hypothetical protein
MDQEHYHCGTCKHGVLYSAGCDICEDGVEQKRSQLTFEAIDGYEKVTQEILNTTKQQ